MRFFRIYSSYDCGSEIINQRRSSKSNMKAVVNNIITSNRDVWDNFFKFFTVFIWMNISFKVNACNVDITKPIRYSGNIGDYFGYTVLQHKNINSFVLIGAPKANSTHQPGLDTPGTVYSCMTVSPYTCNELPLDGTENEDVAGRRDNKDGQWLGVAMARENMADGFISVCGHLYTNNFFVESGITETQDKYINGICYSFGLSSSGSSENPQRRFPCLDGDQWSGATRVNSWCQAGMGIAYTKTVNNEFNVLYGAPGYYNWTGAVVLETESNVFTYSPVGVDQEDYYGYSGYSVAAGRFIGKVNAQQGVMGAPRANELIGMVTIYDLDNNTIYQKLTGINTQFTYFGGAIATVDLNKDGYTDLLVGAPLYSKNQDEGKVYVYLNTGSSNPILRLVQEIQGSKAFRARFGTSIFGAGDLNQDGFEDVLIGAPYEDDGVGAVYIYHGTSEGVDPAFSQRISGSDFDPTVTTFGISVYGGIDMDGNRFTDIAVGAYDSDTAFLFKTQPLITLEAWLELTPSSVDPDNKDVAECVLRGVQRVCISVKICFRFSGLPVTKNLQITYKLSVDDEKRGEGINSRFGLTEDLLNFVEGQVGMKENQKECESIMQAYLHDNARDFLTTVPFKLEYNVFKYEIETEKRGDEPYQFPSGLPPVNDNFNCDADTITEKVRFVQNCGSDGICQTDIKVAASVDLPEGKTNELILGASTTLYVIARIDNMGEEAHQAILNVYHPSDLGYEGVEVEQVHCLPEANEQGASCIPEVVATCSPQFGAGTSVVSVDCSIGNPMNAYNSATLRLRFDASDIPWSVDRKINITMVVSTVSIEEDREKANNVDQLKFSVIVEADLGVVGVSQPESIYYGYNASSLGYKDQTAADKAKLEAALEAQSQFYESNYDKKQYNETWIGPAFKHEFQVINYGPGRLPLTSNVTIHIPWRTLDGDWLVFIRKITISNQKGSCNESPILLHQKLKIEERYYSSSNDITFTDEENYEQLATDNKPRQLGCSKAICVDVSCSVERLENDETVKIIIDSLLWEHTFVTREYGFVEIVSEATVTANDVDDIHNQPEDDKPDNKILLTVAYTDTMGQEPIPWWIILVAILAGLLLLVLAVLGLWKLGFFKRGLKEEMAEEAAGGEGASGKTAPDGGANFKQVPTTDS